jgi:hypothetical protein
MKEGKELLKQSIKEENEKNFRKSTTLDFLDDPIPKSEKGEYIILNIVQLARKNYLKKERKKLKKKREDLKKLLYEKNKNNPNFKFIRDRIDKKENISSTLRTIDDNERKYELFANNLIEKLHNEKKKNLIDVNKIRKEIETTNDDYFTTIMKEKKSKTKNINQGMLTKTYNDLQKINRYKKNKIKSLILPPLKNQMHLNLNSERNNNDDINNKRYKTIINLYDQASIYSLLSNQIYITDKSLLNDISIKLRYKENLE